MITCRDNAQLSDRRDGTLRWHLSTTADEVVMSLQGEVDLASAPALAEAIAGLLAKKPSRLVVELARLSFMDSTGISCLVKAATAATAARCDLLVRNPTPDVLRVLEICGVDKLLLDNCREEDAATRR